MIDMSTSAAPATTASLAPNTPRRFYRGGERILSFRGLEAATDFDGFRPEDWVGSSTIHSKSSMRGSRPP